MVQSVFELLITVTGATRYQLQQHTARKKSVLFPFDQQYEIISAVGIWLKQCKVSPCILRNLSCQIQNKTIYLIICFMQIAELINFCSSFIFFITNTSITIQHPTAITVKEGLYRPLHADMVKTEMLAKKKFKRKRTRRWNSNKLISLHQERCRYGDRD